MWQRTGVEGPICARSTTGGEDSNRASLNAKVVEPNLPRPCKEGGKPKLLKSHVGVDDSERPAPKADGFDPERAILRKEEDEPQSTKSKVEGADPGSALPEVKKAGSGCPAPCRDRLEST